MIIKGNSEEVKRMAMSLQSIGKLIESELERELMRAGADVVVVVSHRVKREGTSATGAALETKAKKKEGKYSRYYGRLRLDKGRQVQRVDLTMTGQMFADYNLTEKTPRVVGVGFLTEKSHEIADGLEQYYGSEIFIPSDEEEQEIMEDAMQRIEILIEKAQ